MCFKKQKEKRKSPIKDWRKAKEKEKISDQRLKESKRKRKNSWSKIGRKQKINIQKNHWTRMSEQCTELSKRKRKKKATKVVWKLRDAGSSHLPSWHPNLCARTCSHWTKEKRKKIDKGKARTPKSQIPHQTHHSRKSPIDPLLRMLSLIWLEMICKVKSWYIYGSELGWNTCLCEIYTL